PEDDRESKRRRVSPRGRMASTRKLALGRVPPGNRFHRTSNHFHAYGRRRHAVRQKRGSLCSRFSSERTSCTTAVRFVRTRLALLAPRFRAWSFVDAQIEDPYVPSPTCVDPVDMLHPLPVLRFVDGPRLQRLFGFDQVVFAPVFERPDVVAIGLLA